MPKSRLRARILNTGGNKAFDRIDNRPCRVSIHLQRERLARYKQLGGINPSSPTLYADLATAFGVKEADIVGYQLHPLAEWHYRVSEESYGYAPSGYDKQKRPKAEKPQPKVKATRPIGKTFADTSKGCTTVCCLCHADIPNTEWETHKLSHR